MELVHDSSISVGVSGHALPAIEPILKSDGRVKKTVWRLARNYQFEHPVTGEQVVIEAGFEFDGATIPPLFWTPLRLHPFSPRVVASALEHDKGYHEQWNRKATDKQFHENLKLNGVDDTRAYLMYLAVRMFGWVFYLSDDSWIKKLLLKVI